MKSFTKKIFQAGIFTFFLSIEKTQTVLAAQGLDFGATCEVAENAVWRYSLMIGYIIAYIITTLMLFSFVFEYKTAKEEKKNIPYIIGSNLISDFCTLFFWYTLTTISDFLNIFKSPQGVIGNLIDFMLLILIIATPFIIRTYFYKKVFKIESKQAFFLAFRAILIFGLLFLISFGIVSANLNMNHLCTYG